MTQHPSTIARKAARYPIAVPGRVKGFGTVKPRAVTVSDLSTVGCQLAPAETLHAGVQLLVKVPGSKYWPATVVWKRHDRVGVQFAHPLHPLAVEEFARQVAEIAELSAAQSA